MSDNNDSGVAKSHLRKPPTFDGKNYQTWMMATELYIRANPKGFPTDESRILFALSFMTEGQPVPWSLDFNESVLNADVVNFGTWAAFKEKLKASFEDKEKAKNARTALHQLKQGTQTAEEFFLQFELLRRAAGITDEGELVAFLEGGAIDKKILTQMYYSNTELPATYDDWKKKIIAIDGLHRRMKMWDTPGPRPAYRPLPTPPRQAQWNPPRQQAPYQPAASSSSSQNWRPGTGKTYGGLGKPMDLDEAKRLGVCLKCGQAGHIGKWCPNARPPAQTRQQEYFPLPPPQQYYMPPAHQQQQPQQQVVGPSSSLPFDVRKMGYEDMKKMVDTWQDEQKRAYGDAQRRQSDAGKLGF
jgi:hypothetical protein